MPGNQRRSVGRARPEAAPATGTPPVAGARILRLNAAVAVGYRVLILFATLVGTPSPVLAQVLIQPFAQELNVHDIEHDEVLWLAAEQGLFYYADGVGLQPFHPGLVRKLYCIERVGDELWVGGEGGIFTIADGILVPVPFANEVSGELEVHSIVYEPATSGVWLMTNRGMYIRPKAGGEFLPSQAGFPTFLGIVAGEVWASSFEDSFRYRDGAFEPLNHRPLPGIVDVAETAEGIYLKTFSGTIRQPGSVYRYPDHLDKPIVKGVLDIASIDGQLWLSIGGQVRGPPGRIVRFQNDEPIEFIGETNEYIWLASHSTVHRRRRDLSGSGFELVAGKYSAFSLFDAADFFGEAWLWGGSGALRLYDDVTMEVSLDIVEDNLLGIFRNLALGDSFGVEGVRYRQDGKGWNSPGREEFGVILSSSEKELEKQKEGLSYIDPAEAVYRPSSPFSRIHLSVRDAYGNIQDFPYYDSVLFIGQTKILKLGLIATLVLVFFVVSFKMLPLLPASPALNLYFFFVNYFPILKRLAAPSFRRSRVLLRKIYANRCSTHQGDRLPEDQRKPFFAKLVKERSHLIWISPEEKAAGVTLSALRNEVLCRQDHIFAEVFPLPLSLHDGSEHTYNEIRENLLRVLARELPGATKEFCEKLMIHGRFLFLFSATRGQGLLLAQLKFLHEVEAGNGWIILQENAD